MMWHCLNETTAGTGRWSDICDRSSEICQPNPTLHLVMRNALAICFFLFDLRNLHLCGMV